MPLQSFPPFVLASRDITPRPLTSLFLLSFPTRLTKQNYKDKKSREGSLRFFHGTHDTELKQLRENRLSMGWDMMMLV